MRFSSGAPDELSLDAALVTAPSGERFFSISACYIGPLDEGQQIIQPLREYGTPVERRIAPVPYLQIQSAGDSLFPRGRRYYWKAQFMREITDQAIDTMLATYMTAPSESLLVLQQVGGAISRVPMDGTPSPTEMHFTIASRYRSGTIRLTTKRTSDGRATCGMQ
ncbi:hypothetical protein [Mesorhizobium sp. M0684]|uniref:hypothetical protein n=1 Tax=unclassified Mesorhizobium TaxID=325217 RepID=UPI00333A652A